MLYDEIVERIHLNIAANGFSQLKPYTEETRLVDDLGMDSLDVLQLEVDLQKEFKLKNLDFDINPPKTIQDLTTLIIYQQAQETHP